MTPTSRWTAFRIHPLTRFLASLKLAVVVIVGSILAMITGTIIESLYGREFAARVVYNSLPFWGILTLLFLNVLFAALVRLPYKKRLGGFYVIHLGILLILAGGTLTYTKGIDGTLELRPNQPTDRVTLADPVLYIGYQSRSAAATRHHLVDLPEVVWSVRKSRPVFAAGDYDVYLDHFLPYADAKETWVDTAPGTPPLHVYWLSLASDRFTEDVQIGNAPGYTAFATVGLLTLAVLPETDPQCLRALADPTIAYLFLYNDSCMALPDLPEAGLNQNGTAFHREKRGSYDVLTATQDGVTLRFYPEIATTPVTADAELDTRYRAHLFETAKLRATPHVFFLRDHAMVYGKATDWTLTQSTLFAEEPLPWMNLTLTITRRIANKYPTYVWSTRLPATPDDHPLSAAHVRVVNLTRPDDTANTWTNPQAEATLAVDGGQFTFFIGEKVHKLDFSVMLEHFKMDTNPGTMDPASYESVVKVIDATGASTDAHVYMNHPLKKGLYTVYQSSYFELPDNQGFGSVFSVNYDPGRAIKYLGSLLLVAGAIYHYYLRRKQSI